VDSADMIANLVFALCNIRGNAELALKQCTEHKTLQEMITYIDVLLPEQALSRDGVHGDNS
jgi:hypothetical protein